MKRVSLKDIATRAGVSVATVSFALNGRAMVARGTADRIQSLAKEMGYCPNPLLASLAGKRFRSPEAVGGVPIALLCFPTLPGGSQRGSDYHVALEIEARKLGYAAKVYSITDSMSPKQICRELYHSMVQGVVITGSLDPNFLSEFDWAPYSVVQCARFSESPPFNTVRPNIFQAIKSLFTVVRQRGYRRIGFAIGRHVSLLEDDEARYGAAIAMEAGYLTKRDQLPVYQGPILDAEAVLAWVRKTKPDAIIGFSVSYYWDLKTKGYRIPQDIGFASMHLEALEDTAFCSGLNQNRPEIARQSILLLDQMIRNRERGIPGYPLHLLVPSLWNEGKTLRTLTD